MSNFFEEMEEDIKNGATVIAPNNLPIRVRTWGCVYMEHEHASHPQYKFPITIEYIGDNPDVLDDINNNLASSKEDHAVLYIDSAIVLTLYECCYYIFYLKNGLGRKVDRYDDWKICEEDLNKLRLISEDS